MNNNPKEQLKSDVLSLTLPSEKFPHGVTQLKIAQILGVSRSNVYSVQRQLVVEGKLKRDIDTKHLLKDIPAKDIREYSDVKKTRFHQIPSIAKWRDHMTAVGTPQNPSIHVSNLYKICKTLNMHPTDFLQNLQSATEYHTDFVKKFRAGESVYINKKKHVDAQTQSNSGAIKYTQALVSFLKVNGMSVPAGHFKTMQKTTGMYSRMYFDDAQMEKLIKFMENKYPQYRDLLIMHHELGLRMSDLIEVRPEWIRQQTKIKVGNIEKDIYYYKCNIFVKKQKRVFSRFIISPKAVQIVKNAQSGQRLIEYTNRRKLKEGYNAALRAAYADLDLIPSDPELIKQQLPETNEWYLCEMPSHIMRHSCVHWLMRMSGQRADQVAAMFWDRPDTLQVYATQQPEELLEAGVCYLCNAPSLPDASRTIFCSFRHALAYYTSDD